MKRKLGLIATLAALSTAFATSCSTNYDNLPAVDEKMPALESPSAKLQLSTETAAEPSLEKILKVMQRTFGYLNPAVPHKYKYLETTYLCRCIGVYVRDDGRQLQALAHIDAGSGQPGLDYGDQTNQFLNDLIQKQLTDGKFDQVLILKSQQANQEDVDKIYSALKMRGHTPEVIYGGNTINVIFDRNGVMHWVDSKTLRSLDVNLMIESRLTCMNESYQAVDDSKNWLFNTVYRDNNNPEL